MNQVGYQDILKFWFEEITPKQWWTKDEDFDAMIRQRFTETHSKAVQCEWFTWRETSQGRLAEIIVLDQFSRNMFRDKAESFAYDHLALSLAQEAIAGGFDKSLSVQERSFLYMPFMHSESLLIHEEAVKLFTDLGVESTLEFEYKHKAIIDKFGRYPHRNAILVRESTAEEVEFLSQPNSSF